MRYQFNYVVNFNGFDWKTVPDFDFWNWEIWRRLGLWHDFNHSRLTSPHDKSNRQIFLKIGRVTDKLSLHRRSKFEIDRITPSTRFEFLKSVKMTSINFNQRHKSSLTNRIAHFYPPSPWLDWFVNVNTRRETSTRNQRNGWRGGGVTSATADRDVTI